MKLKITVNESDGSDTCNTCLKKIKKGKPVHFSESDLPYCSEACVRSYAETGVIP